MHRKGSGEAGGGSGQEANAGESVPPLLWSGCLWSGWKFEPGPITGLAPGQEHSEHALGKTICCKTSLAWLSLHSQEQRSEPVLHLLSPLC